MPKSVHQLACSNGRIVVLTIQTNAPYTIKFKNMKITKSFLIAATMMTVAGTVFAADGKALFEANCVKCHGADGVGNTKMGSKVGVKNLTDAKLQAELTPEKITKAIKEGIKEDDKQKMKAFPDLTAEEIQALITVVQGFKK